MGLSQSLDWMLIFFPHHWLLFQMRFSLPVFRIKHQSLSCASTDDFFLLIPFIHYFPDLLQFPYTMHVLISAQLNAKQETSVDFPNFLQHCPVHSKCLKFSASHLSLQFMECAWLYLSSLFFSLCLGLLTLSRQFSGDNQSHLIFFTYCND